MDTDTVGTNAVCRSLALGGHTAGVIEFNGAQSRSARNLEAPRDVPSGVHSVQLRSAFVPKLMPPGIPGGFSPPITGS